jgi:hypothetical protein
MTDKLKKHINEANLILISLGLPRAQQNERSALCLLALLNLTPGKKWMLAENPLMGITPIMDWARKYYRKEYAPNTRETVRRQTMHQFVAAFDRIQKFLRRIMESVNGSGCGSIQKAKR